MLWWHVQFSRCCQNLQKTALPLSEMLLSPCATSFFSRSCVTFSGPQQASSKASLTGKENDVRSTFPRTHWLVAWQFPFFATRFVGRNPPRPFHTRSAYLILAAPYNCTRREDGFSPASAGLCMPSQRFTELVLLNCIRELLFSEERARSTWGFPRA